MNQTLSLYLFKIHNQKYTLPQHLSLSRKHKLVFPTTPLLTLITKAYNIFQNNNNPTTLHLTSPQIQSQSIHNHTTNNNNNTTPNNKYFIKKILQGSQYQINILIDISSKFSNHNQFTFYTDGSLIGLQTPSCRMGFSWIEPRLNTSYKGSCILHPSSTKSESYAILTMLLVIPNNSLIDIHTDSQNCIHNYNSFSNPLISQRKQLNHNNHLLWSFIMDTIEDKNLTVTLYKVKAHSNNVHNDMADELAAQGLNTEPINLHLNAHVNISLLLPVWNSIKKILQARIFTNFIFNTDLHQIRNVFSTTNINWEYTSLWTKRNQNEEEITSFKHTKTSSYKIKSISHHLPTGDLQSRNYPLLYKDLTPILCHHCHIETDNNFHIGRCRELKADINQIFSEAKTLLITLLQNIDDINHSLIEDSVNSLKCLELINLDTHQIPDSHYIYLWAHNIIPNELILFFYSHIKNTRQIKTILWQFLDVFMNNIRKITWLKRNDLMKQWEKHNGISRKDKISYKLCHYNSLGTRNNNRHLVPRSQIGPKEKSTSTKTNNRENSSDYDQFNSSLFRYYNIHKGKKRKLDDQTPSLNHYHLTDWILYTSSNFLYGRHWTKYISSYNFSLLSYYNSIDFYNFYRDFLFLDFNLDSLGLDTNFSLRPI
jgi:ribonuclease HI